MNSYKPRPVEVNTSGVQHLDLPVAGSGEQSSVPICIWSNNISFEGNVNHPCQVCKGKDVSCPKYLKEGL